MIVIDLHDRAKWTLTALPWSRGQKEKFRCSTPARIISSMSRNTFPKYAVKKLCELLQIPLANTVAAGDQENDISMIEAAAVGAAMKKCDRCRKGECRLYHGKRLQSQRRGGDSS